MQARGSTWNRLREYCIPPLGRHSRLAPCPERCRASVDDDPLVRLAQRVRPEHYGAPTFWSRADQQGRRCIVYDVPETFPEAGFGGSAIFEWGTWAWYGSQASVPQRLIEEHRTRTPSYREHIEHDESVLQGMLAKLNETVTVAVK